MFAAEQSQAVQLYQPCSLTHFSHTFPSSCWCPCLCVSVISSPLHPPLPPLFHSSITQDASPSWKQASQHGKGQGWVGQVRAGRGGHRGCLCRSSACLRPHCVPSWGNQAHVTLAQPPAHTCCHQNGDDALTPALQQLLTHGSHKDACANQLSQLLEPLESCRRCQ